MRAPGRALLLGLLLVLGTAGPGSGRAQPKSSLDRGSLLRLLLDDLAQELRELPPNEAKRLQLLSHPDIVLGCGAETDFGTDGEEQSVEIVPRDLRMKDRFLKHLTGPLYFSPQCRKHFHRLYHNTRDCTIPAYYKRCARLLTRLAFSAECTEG
uniref:ALK and LTK ligand 2 n=1 Tax=Chinchilla lanigera TaxID=34839 RepID=A0A8C2UQH9_CHILA